MPDESSQISVAMERALIKAVHAVIRKDQEDFEAQLETFSTRDAIMAADARCTDLCALIMLQQYGGAPDAESVLELAENTSTIAPWSCIGATEFAAYIGAIFEAKRINEVLGTGSAVRAPFILLANLLVQFRKDDEKWFNYLDRVWELLLDGPPPSS